MTWFRQKFIPNIRWRPSLVPIATVNPAPVRYIKFAAVKRLAVGSCTRRSILLTAVSQALRLSSCFQKTPKNAVFMSSKLKLCMTLMSPFQHSLHQTSMEKVPKVRVNVSCIVRAPLYRQSSEETFYKYKLDCCIIIMTLPCHRNQAP